MFENLDLLNTVSDGLQDACRPDKDSSGPNQAAEYMQLKCRSDGD